MSELTNDLAMALLDERDMHNQVLAAMHRTHMRLLDTLARMEARIQLLESQHKESIMLLDSPLPESRLNDLAESLWNNTSLKATVEHTIELVASDAVLSKADQLWDGHIEDRVNDAISDAFDRLDVEVDNIEVRITGRP